MTGATLDKLKARDISLVVPERFKSSAYSEYESRSNVISFRDFFDGLRDHRGPLWLADGIDCFGKVAGAAG